MPNDCNSICIPLPHCRRDSSNPSHPPPPQEKHRQSNRRQTFSLSNKSGILKSSLWWISGQQVFHLRSRGIVFFLLWVILFTIPLTANLSNNIRKDRGKEEALPKIPPPLIQLNIFIKLPVLRFHRLPRSSTTALSVVVDGHVFLLTRCLDLWETIYFSSLFSHQSSTASTD